MRYEGITVMGDIVELEAPLSIQIRMEEDAPAHSFTGVFSMERAVPDFLKLRIWEKDALVFQGILDEQTVQLDQKGRRLYLTARSLAALLLDNEALPQTYINPSLQTLFSRHAFPYGLPRFSGNGGPFRGQLTVKKGMSEWQVFSEFCYYFLGTSFFITEEGVLDATGQKPPDSLVFSNQGEGIPYLSFRRRKLYGNRIQELCLQAGSGGDYTARLTDPESAAMGIQRRRYITAASYLGERRLKEARRKSEELELVCPCALTGVLGAEARILDAPEGAVITGFTVAKIQYILDRTGEICRFTLRRAEDTSRASVT